MRDQTALRRISIILLIAMGTQFDPNMRIVFMCCRKELERYYSAIR